MAAPGRNGHRWRQLRQSVIGNAVARGALCPICGRPLTLSYRFPHPLSLAVDHIVPVSVDWSRRYDPRNLRCTHLTCNAARGNRPGKVDKRIW